MTKELTPLEAFKEIKELAWLNTDDSDKTEERINIIEKSLKALEILRKIVRYDIEVNENDVDIEYVENDVISKEEYDLLKEVLL